MHGVMISYIIHEIYIYSFTLIVHFDAQIVLIWIVGAFLYHFFLSFAITLSFFNFLALWHIIVSQAYLVLFLP